MTKNNAYKKNTNGKYAFITKKNANRKVRHTGKKACRLS